MSKHGNPRLRTMLVELAWRLMLRQPICKAVAKWLPKFAAGNASQRKKIVLAVTRWFCVDWWRVQTGRLTVGAPAPAYRPNAVMVRSRQN